MLLQSHLILENICFTKFKYISYKKPKFRTHVAYELQIFKIYVSKSDYTVIYYNVFD